MAKQITFILIITTIFSCNLSYAFDYAPVPFHQAITSKKMVCIGLIENIYITQRGEGWIRARARVAIEKCLRGVYCSEKEDIYINYFVQNIHGTIVPIDIELGKQVILALDDNKSVKNYEFDSDINDGVDYCYICNAFPYSIINHDEKFACYNSMIRNDIYNGLLWEEIEKIF